LNLETKIFQQKTLKHQFIFIQPESVSN